MQRSICAQQTPGARFAVVKKSRTPLAGGRPSRSRSSQTVRAVMDPDVGAAFTALVASGALVASLASVIRQANGFDAQDKAVKASLAAKSVPATAVVETKGETKIATKVQPPAPVVVAEKKEAVKPAPSQQVEAPAPAAVPVVAAAAAAATAPPKESPAPVKPAVEPTPAPQIISVSSKDSGVATTLVTEPSLTPKADPVNAAAVLEALTSDAPTGTTAPGSNIDGESSSGPGDSGKKESQPEPMLVGAAVAAVAEAPIAAPETPAPRFNAADASREYESRLARVLADANLATETSVAQKQQRSQVTITEKYQEKIDALWSTYEQKKAQEAALLAKQEKITLDLAALDAAQQAKHDESAGAVNPLVAAAQKVVALLAAVWAFIVALVAKMFGRGGSSQSGGAGVTA